MTDIAAETGTLAFASTIVTRGMADRQSARFRGLTVYTLTGLVCVAVNTEWIEKVFDNPHVVIANYLEPGPRNAEGTLD